MDTSSAALAASVVGLLICAAALSVAWWRKRRRAIVYAVAAALIALAFDLFAAGIHFEAGHPQGTPASLAPAAFLLEHPSFPGIGALSLAFLWLSWRLSRRLA